MSNLEWSLPFGKNEYLEMFDKAREVVKHMSKLDAMVTDAKRVIGSIKQADSKTANACNYLEDMIDRIVNESRAKLEIAEKALEDVRDFLRLEEKWEAAKFVDGILKQLRS